MHSQPHRGIFKWVTRRAGKLFATAKRRRKNKIPPSPPPSFFSSADFFRSRKLERHASGSRPRAIPGETNRSDGRRKQRGRRRMSTEQRAKNNERAKRQERDHGGVGVQISTPSLVLCHSRHSAASISSLDYRSS